VSKIPYTQYLAMLNDLEAAEESILAYSLVKSGRSAFDVQLHPSPEKVEITEQELSAENAMAIGNRLARWRREGRFANRIAAGDKRPVIVSEGDSWFQFPFLVKDIIDHLNDQYTVFSMAAAGDTADNMVFGSPRKYHREYLNKLREHKERVQAFLFSGAGNDIIGDDRATGKPALLGLIKPFNGDTEDALGHIDQHAVEEKMTFLHSAYNELIGAIRSESGFKQLPIILHGYDYAFPHPWTNDQRDPKHAKKNAWLGSAFSEKNIEDPTLRRAVIQLLIDRLYTMLKDIAGESEQSHIWIVDCRGAMPKVDDWIDEIHGTSEGFSEPARRFQKVLERALTPISA